MRAAAIVMLVAGAAADPCVCKKEWKIKKSHISKIDFKQWDRELDTKLFKDCDTTQNGCPAKPCETIPAGMEHGHYEFTGGMYDRLSEGANTYPYQIGNMGNKQGVLGRKGPRWCVVANPGCSGEYGFPKLDLPGDYHFFKCDDSTLVEGVAGAPPAAPVPEAAAAPTPLGLYDPCGDISSQKQYVDNNLGACAAGLRCDLLEPNAAAYYADRKRARECKPDTADRSYACGQVQGVNHAVACNDGLACAVGNANWQLDGRTCSDVQCPEPAPLVTVFDVELAFGQSWSPIQVGQGLWAPSHSLASLGKVVSIDFFPGGFGAVMIRLAFSGGGVCMKDQQDAIALKVVGTANVCASRVSVFSCEISDQGRQATALGHQKAVVMTVRIGATAARTEGQVCNFLAGAGDCSTGLECACVGPCKSQPAGLGTRTCVKADLCSSDSKKLDAAFVEQALGKSLKQGASVPGASGFHELGAAPKASAEAGGSVAVLLFFPFTSPSQVSQDDKDALTASVAKVLDICPSRVSVRSVNARRAEGMAYGGTGYGGSSQAGPAFVVLQIGPPPGAAACTYDAAASKIEDAIATECAPAPYTPGACGEWTNGKCTGAKTMLGAYTQADCLQACKGFKCCVATRGKCRGSNGRIVPKGYATATVPCY